MPRKGSIAIAKNLRKLNEELKEFLETRDELIKKYGEVTEDGMITLKIDSENFSKYIQEIEPIGQMKFNVDLVKITYDDLPETITPEQVLALDFMIEEDNIDDKTISNE